MIRKKFDVDFKSWVALEAIKINITEVESKRFQP